MGSELSSQKRVAAQQPHRGLSKIHSQESQENPNLNKPIGQTEVVVRGQPLPSLPCLPKEIVIVSRGETEEETTRFTFPPSFKPLIPIGQETLPPSVPQIDPNLLIQLGLLVQTELTRKTSFLSCQQNTLSLIIKDIETYSLYINSQVLEDKNRRFGRVVDNFNKLNDIEVLISKIDQDLDICVEKLNLLNRNLPETLRLTDRPLDSVKEAQ